MTRMSRTFVFIGLMVFPMQGGAQVSKTVSGPHQRLQVDSIYQSGRSGVLSPMQTVVRDSATWCTLWSRIVANRGGKPRLPAVDFNAEMVMVVGSGTHNWNGFKVSIDSVILGNSRLTAYVTDVGPGSCVAGAAFTQPVVVVRVPRHRESARFVTRIQRYDC